MVEPRTIMTVHAHPDDEASKGASTLAKYHAQGASTVLVCCTGGEEGDLQNPTLRAEGQPFHGLTPEQERELVGSMRRAELDRSAEVIGFDEVVMLGYRDSGMADTEPNQHPECFHQADIDEATGRLVAVIRRTRPQVIITYGDDQQGYPHPDHLRVHDISVLAFDRAGDPDWYPEHGPVFQPSKLYYATWSRRRLIAVHEGLLAHRGASPYDEKWFERPDTDHRVTTHIEVGEYLWARTGALQAHATQVDPTEAFWFGLSDDELAQIYPWEDWILARSLVGAIPSPTDGDELETDLFAGITADAPVAVVTSDHGTVTVQYHLVVGKKDELVHGPDDAEIVVTVPLDVAMADGFDATVEFMRGRLKASGHSGRVLDLLKSGAATSELSRLASQP